MMNGGDNNDTTNDTNTDTGDFVIHRRPKQFISDPRLHRIARIKRNLGNKTEATKHIQQLRSESNFTSEDNDVLNIAKLYLDRGEPEKAAEVLEKIRAERYANVEANELVKNRLKKEENDDGLGDLASLPVDVRRIIADVKVTL